MSNYRIESAKCFQAICRQRRARAITRSPGNEGKCLSKQFSSGTTPVKSFDTNRVPIKAKSGRSKDHQRQKDFFLSVLSATTTRRDAKSYLTSFKPTHSPFSYEEPDNNVTHLNRNAALDWPLHVALIKLRSPETLSDEVLGGFAGTLSSLSRLGISPVIVIDCERTGLFVEKERPGSLRELLITETNRIVTALQRDQSLNACRLDSVLGVRPINEESRPSVPIRGSVEVQYSDMLRGPIRKGTIPVIPPIGYTTDSQRIVDVEADQVMLALTRDFAGFNPFGKPLNKPNDIFGTSNVFLDRIILLDPLGGIPSAERSDKSHIFINMEQEYWDIKQELLGAPLNEAAVSEEAQLEAYSNRRASELGRDTPFSQALDPETLNHPPRLQLSDEQVKDAQSFMRARHVANLDLLQRTLSLLPPTSSALLTTPTEAATLTGPDESATTPSLGVRTRSPRNPLIYNLLTNKPLISSSLPVARVDSSQIQHLTPTHPITPATFCKRGMPLTIIPDPRIAKWTPPTSDSTGSSLTLHDDPRIDFPRLLNLMEDSFGRRLDVNHYLSRIKNRIAGLIVAGSYEGGAILTWELPPPIPESDLSSSDPTVADAARHRMVPYLDKFAVLKRSQGSGGVADIVFTAMVRSCFPGGVCWRSRRENPVNKWYFERSAGTYKVPGDKWTMFWTTEGLTELDGGRRFEDYLGVCANVGASWTDGDRGME